MDCVMKNQMACILIIAAFLVSCSRGFDIGQQRVCGPADTSDRPSWVSSSPGCDNQYCYFMGMSEENMTTERLALDSAKSAALLNLLKDRGIESRFENEIFKRARTSSTSRTANPVNDWEQYRLFQLKKLVKTSVFQKWHTEVGRSCEYDSQGETFYKVFALLQISKDEFNFLEQWRRNQVIHRLIEDSKKSEVSRQYQEAIKLLRKAVKELSASATNNNQLWLSEISKSKLRIGRRPANMHSKNACDPKTGCDPEPDNVFKDRQNPKYWISEKKKKTRIRVKISKNSGRRLRKSDFARVTIKYYNELSESMENYNYRIQKHMLSRGNLGLDGRPTGILTEASFIEADDYCIQLGEKLFGEPMQVAQLYQFEHALRQQKIFRDPRIGTELIVIPDDDPESGQLILTDDNFPFRYSHIKMLLFNWRTLTYSTALQTERGKFGFRCLKEEEIGEQDSF